MAGSLEVVAGLPDEAGFPLDAGLAFLDFKPGGALKVAHFVDDVCAETGRQRVELGDLIIDLVGLAAQFLTLGSDRFGLSLRRLLVDH
jgi:hypothetical protein